MIGVRGGAQTRGRGALIYFVKCEGRRGGEDGSVTFSKSHRPMRNVRGFIFIKYYFINKRNELGSARRRLVCINNIVKTK